MPLDGKQLNNLIARRAERRTEAKREAQRELFSSKEAEREWLTALAERSIRNSGFTIEELDAERERERMRKA